MNFQSRFCEDPYPCTHSHTREGGVKTPKIKLTSKKKTAQNMKTTYKLGHSQKSR